MQLINELSNPINYTGSEAVTVTLPLDEAINTADLFIFDGNSLEKLPMTIKDNQVFTETLKSLGVLVVADQTSVPEWFNQTVVDTATGVILKAYSVTDEVSEEEKKGSFNQFSKQFITLVVDKKDDKTAILSGKETLLTSEGNNIVNPQVKTIYRLSMAHTLGLGQIEYFDEYFSERGAS